MLLSLSSLDCHSFRLSPFHFALESILLKNDYGKYRQMATRGRSEWRSSQHNRVLYHRTQHSRKDDDRYNDEDEQERSMYQE